jgi:hypothetical protein
MPIKLAMQSMAFPTRHLHILDPDCLIQNVKLYCKSLSVFRLNPRLRSRLEELLNALMPEALDHKTIVYRDYTLCVMKLLDRMQSPPRIWNPEL